MLKVKGFSYDTDSDKDVIAFIDSKPKGSRSQYVWHLVRKDMNSESIESIIKKEIEKYLEGVEIKGKETSVPINTTGIMDILSM